jgi:hypothetical protein
LNVEFQVFTCKLDSKKTYPQLFHSWLYPKWQNFLEKRENRVYCCALIQNIRVDQATSHFKMLSPRDDPIEMIFSTVTGKRLLCKNAKMCMGLHFDDKYVLFLLVPFLDISSITKGLPIFLGSPWPQKNRVARK